jgi:hypothetical protein
MHAEFYFVFVSLSHHRKMIKNSTSCMALSRYFCAITLIFLKYVTLTEFSYGLLSPVNNSGIIGKVWGLKKCTPFSNSCCRHGNLSFMGDASVDNMSRPYVNSI